MKRLAIFAGYDKDNIVDDYVVYYIKELKKVADIIYVSDCDMLGTELEKISPYCIHIINGRHGEYDFGSYKRGYIYANEQKILKNYDYLMLCNDSVFGPFFDLNNIVINMESKNTDVWGMFKSLKDEDNEEHLQTYFISIKKHVFLSDEYHSFINSIQKEKEKIDVINKYEIGMSILFRKYNYSISSFLDSSIKSDLSINNHVILFDSLNALKHGFPFLKITLLKDYEYLKKCNLQTSINDLLKIMKLISNYYDVNLIIKYLNRFPTKIRKDIFHQKQFIHKKFLFIEIKSLNQNQFKLIIVLFNKIFFTLKLENKYLYYYNFNFLYKYKKLKL